MTGLLGYLRRLTWHEPRPRDTVLEESRRASSRVLRQADRLQRAYETGSVYQDIEDVVRAVDRRRPANPGNGKA